MKTLYLLRHAQAAGSDIGGTDKTRKLTPKGVEDAKALGALMSRDSMTPDLVLCSSALRTRETLENVLKCLDTVGDNPSISYSDALYNADYNILLKAIQDVSDDAQCVLVVAHNPGIHELAARLAKDDGSGLVDRLSMSYAPATMSVLLCDIDDWSDLSTYCNVVKAVHETIDYNADDRPTRWM